MRYRNPELGEKLAAEYVLGTLRGRARARFEALMRYDPALRGRVTDWEDKLTPLARAGTDIAPPARLWNALSQRIAGEAAAALVAEPRAMARARGLGGRVCARARHRHRRGTRSAAAHVDGRGHE